MDYQVRYTPHKAGFICTVRARDATSRLPTGSVLARGVGATQDEARDAALDSTTDRDVQRAMVPAVGPVDRQRGLEIIQDEMDHLSALNDLTEARRRRLDLVVRYQLNVEALAAAAKGMAFLAGDTEEEWFDRLLDSAVASKMKQAPE